MTTLRWTTHVLAAGLVIGLAAEAQAQTCRKICYPSEGKDDNGCCVDKRFLKPKKTTEPEKKCPLGKMVSADTAKNCCWPGQVWAGGQCRGIPSTCPAGHAVEKEECVVRGCPTGKTRTEDGVHCCWPGQVWAKGQKRCVGIPSKCPKNWKVEGQDCLQKGIGGWVALPGGRFGMGSEGGDRDEAPVHLAELSGFSIKKSEVTVAEYRVCVEEGKCTPAADDAVGCNWSTQAGDREDHPINCVTFEQAERFCAFAGGRLPTEAEWEFAARGGGKGVTYPWGEDGPSCRVAIIQECRGSSTAPVCTRLPGHTEQGLCDMAGNVWEWTQDWYHKNTYKTAGPKDPMGPDSGSKRVRRGGSFSDTSVRTTDRSASAPGETAANIGFRCVRAK